MLILHLLLLNCYGFFSVLLTLIISQGCEQSEEAENSTSFAKLS